jgi:hypothetical protein
MTNPDQRQRQRHYTSASNGNLTHRPGWTFTWDADRLPIQITVSPSTTESYPYIVVLTCGVEPGGRINRIIIV